MAERRLACETMRKKTPELLRVAKGLSSIVALAVATIGHAMRSVAVMALLASVSDARASSSDVSVAPRSGDAAGREVVDTVRVLRNRFIAQDTLLYYVST